MHKVFSLFEIHSKELMRENQEFQKNTFVTYYLKLQEVGNNYLCYLYNRAEWLNKLQIHMIKYYTILKITFLTVFTDVGKYAIVLRNCKSSTIINLYNYMQHINICIKE